MDKFSSVNQHNFAKQMDIKKPRSKIDRSFTHRTTFNASKLIPFYTDEVLPGDTFSVQSQALIRLATPQKPIMDNIYVDTFYFFVPNRLVWEHWKNFCGEQKNPNDTIDYRIPKLNVASGGFSDSTLSDYLTLPPNTNFTSDDLSCLYHRAYNLIYNDWFRDENLQDSVVQHFDDTNDDESDYQLLSRGKRHDYFTSCLPWPQKGDAVQLPLSGNAPVLGLGLNIDSGYAQYQDLNSWDTLGNQLSLQGTGRGYAGGYPTSLNVLGKTNPLGGTKIVPDVYADMSDVTSATITQLREAIQIQSYLELNARSGTRYVEMIKSHFGVISPDFRLQYPEYLGGSTRMANITPVAQTSGQYIAGGGGAETTPQANLSAVGTISFSDQGFTKSFTEHGMVIGILSARADLTYQKAVNRQFTRSTLYDFYDPMFNGIGEQAVLSQEIYASGDATTDQTVFGYQERFAEYRYKPSVISGKFRSGLSDSLDIWHLSQDFGSVPTLSSDFITENVPMDRIKAVTSEPDFLADIHITNISYRPMPIYSTPASLLRF